MVTARLNTFELDVSGVNEVAIFEVLNPPRWIVRCFSPFGRLCDLNAGDDAPGDDVIKATFGDGVIITRGYEVVGKAIRDAVEEHRQGHSMDDDMQQLAELILNAKRGADA